MNQSEKNQLERQEYAKRIGEHIRKLRLEKGMTGVQLAKNCELDKQDIHRLEKGKFNPTVFFLERIARGLGMTIQEVLKDFK